MTFSSIPWIWGKDQIIKRLCRLIGGTKKKEAPATLYLFPRCVLYIYNCKLRSKHPFPCKFWMWNTFLYIYANTSIDLQKVNDIFKSIILLYLSIYPHRFRKRYRQVFIQSMQISPPMRITLIEAHLLQIGKKHSHKDQPTSNSKSIHINIKWNNLGFNRKY